MECFVLAIPKLTLKNKEKGDSSMAVVSPPFSLLGALTPTAHCAQIELVPLDTEHWYIPESLRKREDMFRDDPEICTWELLPLSCTPSLYQLSVIPVAAKYPQVKEAVSP